MTIYQTAASPSVYPPKQWLSERELAEHLGISVRTIYNWRKHGQLIYVKRGKLLFYNWEDVHAMLFAERQLKGKGRKEL